MSPPGHLASREVFPEALHGALCTLALLRLLHLEKASERRQDHYRGLKPTSPCQMKCLRAPLTLNLLGTSKKREGLDAALPHPLPGRLHILVHQLPGRLPAQTLHSFGTVLSVTAHLGCQ